MVCRGPDGSGVACHGPVGLAHRRLSIIDLEGGQQPMYNEDKTLALTFNGEIYDYQRIRNDLIDQGHTLATESDSEVLLHLYEEHGPDMVKRLNGMFAFAIADLRSNEIFLARDRLGQKPLFYTHRGDRFAFASGPVALKPVPWLDWQLDSQAVHTYIELLYVPTPDSIVRDIKKLPPGHSALFRNGKLTITPYWQPRVSADFRGNYDDARAALQETLAAAVKRRLVADVPLGLFLSGGMDSSLICALAQEELSTPAETFSIGFPDPRYDERDYAQAVADHLGTSHHFMEVNPGRFEALPAIVERFEEPFADSSMLPSALLAEYTRQHVTVALSGDAADELFGGYYRYRVLHLYSKLRRLPRSLRSGARSLFTRLLPKMREERSLAGKAQRLLNPLGSDGIDLYLAIISRLPSATRELIHGEPLRSVAQSPETLLQEKLGRELRDVNDLIELELQSYLNDDILVKVDRASMMHSLEIRSPFLDPAVVDLALQLPYAFKQKGGTRKRILRDAFRDRLPAEIFTRRKMGFGVPIAAWLRGSWREPARQLLLDGSSELFSRSGLEQLLHQHQQGEADHSYTIYALMVLNLWLAKG